MTAAEIAALIEHCEHIARWFHPDATEAEKHEIYRAAKEQENAANSNQTQTKTKGLK